MINDQYCNMCALDANVSLAFGSATNLSNKTKSL